MYRAILSNVGNVVGLELYTMTAIEMDFAVDELMNLKTRLSWAA